MSQSRKVLVTGASSGIGKATAQRFAAEGWDVCVNARRKEILEELTASFPEGDHIVVAGDYSRIETANALEEAMKSRWGRLDALVNCAGMFKTVDPVDTPVEEWSEVFLALSFGAVYTSRLAARLMSGGGRIIHITSIHGNRAETYASSYSMGKAAINQYCRALALELAHRNILVNAIAPGFVRTPMSVVNGVDELDSDWFKANYVEGHHLPLKRPGKPEEIAGVAYFLAGTDASYLTGQVITVDGGLTITF